MNDTKYQPQLVLGRDGTLAIATPLYILSEAVDMDKLEGHSVVLCKPEAAAYVVEFDEGDGGLLVNAKVLTDRCEFLGPL